MKAPSQLCAAPQLALVVLLAGASLACSKRDTASGAPAASAAVPPPPTPKTNDRLPPGALVEGPDLVFGLRLPREAKIEALFAKSAHVSGPWPTAELGEYLKERIAAAHVEVADKRLIFPRAHIRGGDGRIFRLEIIDEGLRRRLSIDDITPQPRVEGITEEERWRRAGMLPSGKLANEKDLE